MDDIYKMKIVISKWKLKHW